MFFNLMQSSFNTYSNYLLKINMNIVFILTYIIYKPIGTNVQCIINV